MFQYCAQSSYQKCSKNYFNKRNSISWKYCEIVEKVQFYKTDQCICSFFFLKADIFLYFGETNTVIKLSRNPKQKYCYFKDSSSSHSHISGGRGIITEVTSGVCCVTMSCCHIIHCLLTRLTRRETRNVLPLVFFSFPPPSRVNTH